MSGGEATTQAEAAVCGVETVGEQADADLRTDRALAEQLPRAWSAFFGRFGRLTAVQRAAIPPILAGRDLVLASATASGKTEAACAPLVERYLDSPGVWTLLYISPTRALVNDLFERLQRPFSSLGLRVARRTGDHRDPVERPPHLLLTTPESFDSLLCRGRFYQPDGHVLARVVAVVLDEIHLLHGTARGEQLRWLLQRLRRLRTDAVRQGWTPQAALQVVALSATLPDVRAVRDTYLADGELLQVPGGRPIETVAAPCELPAIEEALPAYLAACERPEKVLVFCNQRRRVDDLTAAMRPVLEMLGYSAAAHHGSLSQKEREAAEAAIKRQDRMVLFATSTLEIGVDIGDIDLVVLDGPAPDVPALLQRIGRGNRRTDRTRVMACAGSLAEVVVHAAMIDAAREGWLGPVEHGPQHAVARQQVASYIFQAPQRTRRRVTLQRLLDECAAPAVAGSLLDLLVVGELREGPEGIRLGKEWLDLTARGEIHSTIEDAPGSRVVDRATGRELARGVRFRGGSGLNVGGRLLEVRSWTERRLEVAQAAHAWQAEGQWSYASRAWLKGSGQPQAVRRYLGLAEDVWPVLQQAETAYVFHFGGGRRRALLELIAGTTAGLAPVRVNEWFVALPGEATAKPAWLARVSAPMLEVAIASRLESLERVLGRPRANHQLPIELRIDEVRGWLQLGCELDAMRAARWQATLEPDVTTVLDLLRREAAEL